MRVLLVYPEFPDTFWSYKHVMPFVRKRANLPPLGLLTVASLLPKDWEKRLLDMNTTSLTQHDLRWADYVFLSAMVAQRDSVVEVLRLCKQTGTKVVAGGPLFLAEQDSFPEVDHFVLNEAEVTLPPFLRDLELGHPRRVYSSNEFPDITKTPMPQWELLNSRHYLEMAIQYSRGCPFNCEFCNITTMFGHRPRTKTAQQIVAELDGLYRLGWRGNVFFVDDNFIGNKRALKEDLLPALIAWRRGKRGFAFSTEASINLADDAELTGSMVEAGFRMVFVGIETPDEQGLRECNKTQNRGRDLVASVKTLQRAGLNVTGGFIVGFDSDTPSIFRRQIEFIQRSGIVTAMVGLLNALHGTALYERLKREGRLLKESSGNNSDNTLNYRPVMDSEVLHKGYREILLSIYAPRAYYERVRTFLREYKKANTVRGGLGLDQIAAFLRSILVLGLRGRDRQEYWRLFFWTLLRHPRLFEEAITFAVMGFHFRRICEQYVE